MGKGTHISSRVNPYRHGVLEGNHCEDRFGLDLAAMPRDQKVVRSTTRDTYQWLNSSMFNQRQQIYEGRPHLRAKELSDHKLSYYPNTNTNWQDPNCNNNPYEMNIIKNGANHINDKSVFSNYGNWVMKPHLNKTTMYQVDDSGKGREKGVPAHILFGMGMTVDSFHQRDFKSVFELTMDRKIPSEVFTNTFSRQKHKLEGLDSPRKYAAMMEATKPLSKPIQIGCVDSLKDTRRGGHFKHYEEFTKKFDASHHKLPLRK